MSIHSHHRVRSGVPTGGQFAAQQHAEADVRLPEPRGLESQGVQLRVVEPRGVEPTPDGVRAAIGRLRRDGRSAAERFVPVTVAESQAITRLGTTIDVASNKPDHTELTHSLSARTPLADLDERLRIARVENQSEAVQILSGYALAKVARRSYPDAGFVDVRMTADGYRADGVRDRFGDLVPTPDAVLDDLTRYTRSLSTNSQATTYAAHPVTPGNLWIDLDKTTGESAW
ncbi:MAG: hypothetical protein WKF57_03995 [Nakamurella sp.]